MINNHVCVGDLVFRLREYEENIGQYEVIYACADLHGDVSYATWLFSDVMGLVDCKQGEWTWIGNKKCCVVVIGDVVDRARKWDTMTAGENNEQSMVTDEEYLVALLHQWQKLANEKGSRVVVTLGNHDMHRVINERYTTPSNTSEPLRDEHTVSPLLPGGSRWYHYAPYATRFTTALTRNIQCSRKGSECRMHRKTREIIENWPATFQLGGLVFIHAGFSRTDIEGSSGARLRNPDFSLLLNLLQVPRVNKCGEGVPVAEGLRLWSESFGGVPAHTLVKGHCPTNFMDKQFLQKHSVGDNLVGDGRIVVIPAEGNDFGHLVLTDTGTSRAWISHQQTPITHPHWPTYTPWRPGTDAKLHDGYGRLTSVPQVAVYDPRTQKWSSIYTEFSENRNYRTTTERCHTCIPADVIKMRHDVDMPYGVSWTRDQVRMLNESQYLNMQRGAKVGPGLIATTQSGTSLYTDGTGLSEMLMMICDRGSMDGFWTLWCGGNGVYVWDTEERQLIQPVPGTGSPSMPKMGRENQKPYYRVVETKNDGTYDVPIDLVVYFATHHAYVQR